MCWEKSTKYKRDLKGDIPLNEKNLDIECIIIKSRENLRNYTTFAIKQKEIISNITFKSGQNQL